MGAILSVSGALKARAKESCSPELIEVGLPLPPPPSGAKVSPPSTPPLARGAASSTQVRRRVDHLSLAVDDEDDPHWRDACRRDHEAMMTRMQYEVNDRKGIGWERVIDDSQGFWWHEHGMLACFHDRPLESSRAYRESLRVEPKGQYALGALLSLGRVYLGQGLFAEAERAFGELYDGMSRAAERQEFVGKGSTVQATRLLQLSASAQAALAAGGAAGDADAAAADRKVLERKTCFIAHVAPLRSHGPLSVQTLEYATQMIIATRAERERAGFSSIEKWPPKKVVEWCKELDGGKYAEVAHAFARCSGKQLSCEWVGDVQQWIEAAGGTADDGKYIYDAFHAMHLREKGKK